MKQSERLKKAMDEEEDKDERKRLRGQIREMRAACAMLSDRTSYRIRYHRNMLHSC